MIKKGLSVLAASFLLVGLAACNNNTDNAFDNDQNFNTLGNRGDRDIFTEDRGTDFDMFNDRDGMFNRVEERSEPSNLRPYRYSTNQYGAIHPDGNGNENISNLKTTLSSNKYPHTRAILIQDAKFKFVKVNPNQAGKGQGNIQWRAGQWGTQPGQQWAKPNTGQQGAAPTPQQQPQAPAQQPKAPAQQPQAPAQQPQAKTPAAQPETGTQAPADQSISQAARRVIELTNAERRKNGLPDLKADTQLSGVAQKKSEDMRKNNYFSHTSPTYGSPFDMMRDHGVSYKTAGENIAQGQQTPEQVVQAWMNSEGHRKNILSRDFTHIGVGYDANGHHWTQMFVGR